MQGCLQPSSRNQYSVHFPKRARDVHVRQSHITENALDAPVRQWNLLTPSAEVTPASAPVFESGSLYSIPLNVDPNNPAVLHLQSESLPGIARTTAEIEDPLHRKRTRKDAKNSTSLYQISPSRNRSLETEFKNQGCDNQV